MVQLDVCLLRNEVATQKERENCQGDRDRLQKLVHHFLWDAMVTAGRVFPMWAVRHLFWHTQPERAPSGHVHLAVYARVHNCCVETTELYVLSHSLSPHRKHTLSLRDSPHFSPVIYSLSPIIRDLFQNSLTSFTSSHLSCSYSASHSLPHFFSAFSFLSSTRHTPGPIIWPRPPPSPCHYTRWLSCHSVPVATL